jgi:hypothetical protein
MQKPTSQNHLSHAATQGRFNRLFLSTLAIGMTITSALPVWAGSAPTPQGNEKVSSQKLYAQARLNAVRATSISGLSDGVYLYGQSPKPDQVGQGYFIFEVNQRKVVGALYMPRSSFDCAAGSFAGNRLALTVVNSYDRTTNPFDIALERSSNVASNRPEGDEIGLQGFHRISSISQNDYRILNVCKTDFKQQARR